MMGGAEKCSVIADTLDGDDMGGVVGVAGITRLVRCCIHYLGARLDGVSMRCKLILAEMASLGLKAKYLPYTFRLLFV